jgi:hypothetical protein
MKRIYCYLAVLSLLLLYAPITRAQGIANMSLGFGSIQDSANGLGIDNINSANAFGACTPGAADAFCDADPKLDGTFMGFEGDGMLFHHIGIGGDLMFQPSKPGYGPLQYRQLFYDFNGIYAPISNKRFIVQLLGGIGGAHTGFSFNETSCVGVAVCTSEAESVGSASHFQQHLGAGIEIFLTQHIFIRPELDYHHVNGFSPSQFGSDNVLGGMVWVGYNFGSP